MGLSPHKFPGPESAWRDPYWLCSPFLSSEPEAAAWGTSVSSHISPVNAVVIVHRCVGGGGWGDWTGHQNNSKQKHLLAFNFLLLLFHWL